MIKSDLRKSYLAKQRSLSPSERSLSSERIAANFFHAFDLGNVAYLHSFLPIEKFNEVDTWLIIRKVWHDFPRITVVVPRVDFDQNEIRNLNLSEDTELARNSWDIDEPTHDEIVDARMLDAVLVPGLCFDRAGHRVGYGKGFYDRFLRTCRPDCVKIGLSHFDPIEKIDDAHDGDFRLDLVITPKQVTESVRAA